MSKSFLLLSSHILSLATATILLFCMAAIFYEKPASAKPIRVSYGFDREFPPFSYEEAGGKATGFEVELIQAIFTENPQVTLDMRPMQWDLIPLALSSGEISITTGMVRTEQRAKLYLFSDRATFPLQIRIFTKIYNRYPTAAMLRGLPVAVEQGTYQHRLLEEFGGMNIKVYKGRTDGLRALYNDEVVGYCGQLQNTYFYINKLNYGAITTVGTPLGITEMRIAVNRERGDIQKIIDQGFTKIIENGEYDRLYRKWFVRELTDQERDFMIKAATKAAIPAYVPYGGKGRGAAILTATGKVYTACTTENADPLLNLSAIRAAVARAIGDGEFELRAAVLVEPDGRVVTPLPEDLQTLYEFGRGILVVLEPTKGQFSESMLSDLLPDPVIRNTPTIRVE